MARKWITGIDIGHHSAKAVVLVRDGVSLTLVNHLELNGCDAIFSDPHTLKHQDSVKKLKILRKIAPLMRSNAAIVVPESAVISKVVSLEAGLEGQEQVFAIEQAMNHQTPFPIDDIALDFVQEVPEQGSNSDAYRVHVTKKSMVSNWSQTIAKLGFKPKLMDTTNGAIRGAQSWLVTQASSLSDFAVLELGHQHVTLLPPTGVSPDLAKSWSIDTQDTLLSNPSARFKSESEVVFESVAGRVVSQLQLYRSVAGIDSVSGVLLMGGHAMEEGLASVVGKHLSCEVEVADYSTLSCHKSKRSERLPASFSAAFGVAINGLDWLASH